MSHYTAAVQCPMCSHRFTVCVHADLPPTRSDRYTVVCPMNASRFEVSGADLKAVTWCPWGAVVVRPNS
jgi:hypothetical protein